MKFGDLATSSGMGKALEFATSSGVKAKAKKNRGKGGGGSAKSEEEDANKALRTQPCLQSFVLIGCGMYGRIGLMG